MVISKLHDDIEKLINIHAPVYLKYYYGGLVRGSWMSVRGLLMLLMGHGCWWWASNSGDAAIHFGVGTINVGDEAMDFGVEVINSGDGTIDFGAGAINVGDGTIDVGDGAINVGDGAINAGDGAINVGDGPLMLMMGH